jgi:hypothetical protein
MNTPKEGRDSSYNVSAKLNFGGHTLAQVFRKGRICVYERARPSQQSHQLELIVVQISQERMMFGSGLIAAHERYPGNEQWGKFGWSFPICDKEFVFALAENMAGIEGPYGQWVREKISARKDVARQEQEVES